MPAINVHGFCFPLLFGRMPSPAFRRWSTDGAAALDHLVSAHGALAGLRPARRAAIRELNQAYTVMLASKFQLFCRDLHSEAVERLTDAATPGALRPIFRESLLGNRQLDSKNAQPGSLGSDFKRLGIELWDQLGTRDRRTIARRKRLEELNAWRNAIAHQTFTRARPLAPAPPLQLRHVRTWRTACDALARSMDAVVGDHIRAVVGAAPW